ncbi:cys-loop ligand-gated ion channel-like isoform X3 [Ruditapes philippinarum]|uniref:cys-loop ligand-gated ion channel-like isoform X3 n=1 Tax=Ruditapes philippinarum TaxID=129788 RepID=UPI00295AF57A|nr:cys-loop ligand-gated ion channel-like isoform X3 [Ruditapes philippinarum]
MRASYMVRSFWIITNKMTTAIAYSFMAMDKRQRNEVSEVNRRSSNNSEKYLNPGYDNTSESGMSRSLKRRPRKRSSSSTRSKKDSRVKVEIVVQFFKVGEIDTLKEQFNADVIVKAKWREPTLDGQQTAADAIDFARLWSPKLYIENSLGDPKEQIRHRIIYNEKGEAFIYEKRVAKGTFMENLELDDFPFDVQDLTITVASELPISECELVEDRDEHHVVNRQSFVDEQEWHLYVHTECNKKELVIDQVDNSVKRSALSVKCRAARRPGYFVWNIFMITFLICSLAFATFSVEKTLPQNRLQLSFTLVLTAVAFKSVVNSSLPRISYLTYMDKYLLVSMVMLSAVCTWHAIVTRLNHNRPYADRVENIVLTILSVLYIVYNIGFIVIIYLFPCKKRRVMSQKDKEYKRNRRDSLSRTQVAKYKRKPRRQALEQNENINVTAKY